MSTFAIILKILGFLIDKKGANEEVQKAYIRMVEAAGSNGLITVKLRNNLKLKREMILARIKARDEALKQAEQNTPPNPAS